jgi:hypothetical protein
MNTLEFDDILEDSIPIQDDGESIECIECDHAGNIQDVIDIPYEDLGAISASFNIKPIKASAKFIAHLKAKAPKVSPIHIAKLEADIKSRVQGQLATHVKPIRIAKAMSARPATSLVLLPKISEQSICLGTMVQPQHLVDIIRKHAEHKRAKVAAKAKKCMEALKAHHKKKPKHKPVSKSTKPTRKHKPAKKAAVKPVTLYREHRLFL